MMVLFKRYGLPLLAAVLLIALTVTVGGGRIRKTAHRDYYERWIMDDAQMLSAESRKAFSEVNETLDKKYGSVLGVITVQSLNGEDISEAVYRLGEAGGFGQNDLVLLVSLGDRQWYLGYGDQIAQYADQTLRHLFINTLDDKLYDGNADTQLAKLYNALPDWYAGHVPQGGTSANRRSGISGIGFLNTLLVVIALIAVLVLLFNVFAVLLFPSAKAGGANPFCGWLILPILALLFRRKTGTSDEETNSDGSADRF